MGPKRLALWFLIISVALSAALGIMALLAQDFSELQLRIVLTTLTISGASILGLASGALWEGAQGKVLPGAGLVLAVLFALLTILGIWTEPGEAFWKMNASLVCLSVATSHTCMLSLAKLAPRFAWARIAAFGAIYLLAVLIIALIYIEPRGDFPFRLIGINAIVVAALTIMVPMFHYLSRGEVAVPVQSPTADDGTLTTIRCPKCGSPQPNSVFEIQCKQCGCRFVLKIVETGPTEAGREDNRIFSSPES